MRWLIAAGVHGVAAAEFVDAGGCGVQNAAGVAFDL
jgi:hypothetical protein